MKSILTSVWLCTAVQVSAQSGSFIKVPSAFSITTKQWIMQQYQDAAKGEMVLYRENLLTCGGNNYGCQGVVLPVTGLELTGIRLNEEKVRLNWKTFTEINNKGFDIERKFGNSDQFSFAGFVPGSFNSSSVINYEKLDDNTYEGVTYYRLKQTDIDGKAAYSNIVAVKGFNNTIAIKPYSNPARADNIQFSVTGIKAGSTVSIVIFDHAGKKIYENQRLQLSGSLNFAYKGQYAMTAGLYYICLQWNDKKANAGFVVTQ